MRYTPGEDYKVWLERVRMFELGEAYKRLALGQDPSQVIKDLAYKLTEKGLYPIYATIQKRNKKS